jgi:hypothetical protein
MLSHILMRSLASIKVGWLQKVRVNNRRGSLLSVRVGVNVKHDYSSSANLLPLTVSS